VHKKKYNKSKIKYEIVCEGIKERNQPNNKFYWQLKKILIIKKEYCEKNYNLI
jgi:hypothetical protein